MLYLSMSVIVVSCERMPNWKQAYYGRYRKLLFFFLMTDYFIADSVSEAMHLYDMYSTVPSECEYDYNASLWIS